MGRETMKIVFAISTTSCLHGSVAKITFHKMVLCKYCHAQVSIYVWNLLMLNIIIIIIIKLSNITLGTRCQCPCRPSTRSRPCTRPARALAWVWQKKYLFTLVRSENSTWAPKHSPSTRRGICFLSVDVFYDCLITEPLQPHSFNPQMHEGRFLVLMSLH